MALEYELFEAKEIIPFVAYISRDVTRLTTIIRSASITCQVAPIFLQKLKSRFFLFMKQQHPANIPCHETFWCHLKRIKTTLEENKLKLVCPRF